MSKDSKWKNYCGDNRRYADIINGIGCGGKQLIQPADLQDVDPTEKKKSRDLLRKVAMGVNFAIIGIENQEKEYQMKKDKTNVCKAIRDLMEDSKIAGREEGREEGKSAGIEMTKLESAKNLLDLLSDEVISERINLPLSTVQALRLNQPNI